MPRPSHLGTSSVTNHKCTGKGRLAACQLLWGSTGFVEQVTKISGSSPNKEKGRRKETTHAKSPWQEQQGWLQGLRGDPGAESQGRGAGVWKRDKYTQRGETGKQTLRDTAHALGGGTAALRGDLGERSCCQVRSPPSCHFCTFFRARRSTCAVTPALAHSPGWVGGRVTLGPAPLLKVQLWPLPSLPQQHQGAPTA